MSTAPVVETKRLSRRFGEVAAVDDVSFSVEAGEIFGLIGPNGAGKSTLIKILTSLLPPSSGSATVAGFDVANAPKQVRKHIGYVPHTPSSDRELTGYENLLLSARLYLIPRHEREHRIEEALVMMSLRDARHRMVRDYSGGMLRRLEIAQSTLHRPTVLLMDEPTVGLDPGGRRTLWQHVRELNRTLGTTIVMTTNDMDEAEALCHRVAVLQTGKLRAVGATADLKAIFAPSGSLEDVYETITAGGSPRA